MIRSVLRRPDWSRPAGRGLVAALLTGLVAVAAVAGLLQVRIDTGTTSFLPSGDAAVAAMADRDRSFGGDPVVVLLKSAQARDLLVDEQQLARLLALEGRLAGLPDVSTVYGPATVLNQTAIAAQNLLAQISGRRDFLRNEAEQKARQAGRSAAEISAAGDDAVADFDRRYGRLMVEGLPAGLPTLRNPQFVRSVVFGSGPGARPQWRFLVPAEDTVTVLVRPREDLDQAAASRLVHRVHEAIGDSGLDAERVTVTGVPAVTTALADRAQAEFPLLGAAAVLAVALLFFLVPWSARRRARLRPLAAVLAGTVLTFAVFGWLGLPISLGVIAFLPIMLGIGSDFPLYLAQPARRRSVLVAALAGAAGFAALALSPLPFVRELGLALALGMVLTVGVALALRRWFDTAEPAAAGRSSDSGPTGPGRRTPRWAALAAAIALAAVGWGALPGLGIEARPDQLARGLTALDQAREAERVLGTSAELSVVLEGDDVLSPQALAWTRKASAEVVREHGSQARPILSPSELLGFLGQQPTDAQIKAAARILPSYLLSSVVTADHRKALLVFGIGLTDVDQQRALLDGLRASLPAPPPGFSIDVVGLPVVAVHGYDAISAGRTWLNLSGIGVAGLILAFGLAHRRDALRAVLAVVLATGWVLGAVWAAGLALSPLTVAIGALVTATGCEFTVMLSEAQRGRRWLRRSVMLAASAAVIGYSVLTASEIAMLQQFGMLLAAGVVASYLAALLVTWSLPARAESAERTENDRPSVDHARKVCLS